MLAEPYGCSFIYFGIADIKKMQAVSLTAYEKIPKSIQCK